jgi:hypothetical protein
VALLLADLGVTKTHARPHVSNDNPFSEAQFKTLKYRPEFPARFGGIEDARAFCHRFFLWYNTEHHHAGLGLLTPAVVHYGDAGAVAAARQAVLTAAYAAHPERFVHTPPTPPAPPAAVWINAPPGSTTLNLGAPLGAHDPACSGRAVEPTPPFGYLRREQREPSTCAEGVGSSGRSHW